MIENLDWNHVISAALGGSGVSFLMRLLVKRILSKFDELIDKLDRTTQRLLVLETRLEVLGILEANVARHERELAELEIKVATCSRGLFLSRGETHGTI